MGFLIYNVKLNLEKLRITLKTLGEYLFPVEKVTSYFKSIKTKSDLQKFIQQRSAHVTQNTLYGYLKTRMGHKFTLMVQDEIFEKANREFIQRYANINFKNYYLNEPFKESCLALFKWSPIADELKKLDEKIVLNSMRLKWNLIDEEFKKLTKNLNFS